MERDFNEWEFQLYLHKFGRKGKHEIAGCGCLGKMFENKEVKKGLNENQE